jgi:hypothetical protein
VARFMRGSRSSVSREKATRQPASRQGRGLLLAGEIFGLTAVVFC